MFNLVECSQVRISWFLFSMFNVRLADTWGYWHGSDLWIVAAGSTPGPPWRTHPNTEISKPRRFSQRRVCERSNNFTNVWHPFLSDRAQLISTLDWSLRILPGMPLFLLHDHRCRWHIDVQVGEVWGWRPALLRRTRDISISEESGEAQWRQARSRRGSGDERWTGSNWSISTESKQQSKIYMQSIIQ
jgi:hypothetical protein